MGDKVQLPCPAGGGCNFTTIELIYEHANQQLQSHIDIVHGSATSSSAVASHQAERVKRPMIQFPVTQSTVPTIQTIQRKIRP